MRAEALEAMTPLLERGFGNPQSVHTRGQAAAVVIGKAREQVASLINGDPGELVFTATGSEANNLAVQGIARARDRADTADLRVFLLGEGDEPELEVRPGDLIRQSKADLSGDPQAISSLTGQGIEQLLTDLGSILSERVQRSSLATRERHRVAFLEGRDCLDAALRLLDLGPERYDVASEEVRVAIRRLEALIGRVDVENLLDHIFASFCLGK